MKRRARLLILALGILLWARIIIISNPPRVAVAMEVRE